MADQRWGSYSQSPVDLHNLPENVTGLLGAVSGFVKDVETACSSEGFIVRHVIGPAVEATLSSYFKYCIPETEQLLSAEWHLCLPDHTFNCDNIHNYTSQCKQSRRDGITLSTPSTEHRHTSQDGGPDMLMAAVALIIGIVLGVVLTVTVCLVWPRTFRWANTKLGRKTLFTAGNTRQQSVASDYYAAIDDRQNHQNVHFHATTNRKRDTIVNNENYQMIHTDNDDATHSDSGIQIESRAPAPNPATPRLDDDESHDESRDSYNYSSISYEQLNRHRPHNQSHNYDHITPSSPLSPVESEHSYFVLEKPSGLS